MQKVDQENQCIVSHFYGTKHQYCFECLPPGLLSFEKAQSIDLSHHDPLTVTICPFAYLPVYPHFDDRATAF